MVSECSVRGRILGLLADGVPRSVSGVAAELGLGVRSVLWTLYDLHRLGLVLRSVKPVGVLPVQLAGRDVALKESAYCVASDCVVDGAVIRGVRYVKWKNRNDGGLDRKIQGTIQSRIMGVLSNGAPRGIKEIAGQLGLGEVSVYNAVYLLYKRGALLRTEKPRAQRDSNGWAMEEARHLWKPRTNGETSCFVNGEAFIEHKPRPSKSLSQSIIEYVREHLHDRAAFTTGLRTKLEERLGTKHPAIDGHVCPRQVQTPRGLRSRLPERRQDDTVRARIRSYVDRPEPSARASSRRGKGENRQAPAGRADDQPALPEGSQHLRYRDGREYETRHRRPNLRNVRGWV